MSIKWGTDLSGISPTLLSATAAADVDCTAGAFVTALSVGGAAGALAQSTNQDFIAMIQGVMTFVFGVAAPTALSIIFATTAGTPIDTYTVEPGLLIAAAEIVIPIYLLGVSSSALFAGAGATPLVQVFSTTNDTTLKAVGSRAFFSMSLGND